MPETFTLLCPVYSYLKPSVIYGNIGDKVILVKDMGSCLIVENEKGDRFPISQKKVTMAKIDLKPVSSKMEPTQKPKHKHQNQKNLF